MHVYVMTEGTVVGDACLCVCLSVHFVNHNFLFSKLMNFNMCAQIIPIMYLYVI